MVRKLTLETRRKVVEFWFDGDSYRNISTKLEISLGAISSIIEEEKKKIPDIEVLRKLKITLSKAGVKLASALRGAALLNKLNNLGIPINSIPVCINLLTQYGEKTSEVLEAGQRLKMLEATQGKSYTDIVAEAAEKTRELQDATYRIKDLNSREENITKSLRNLEHLKTLSDKMNRCGLTLTRLDGFIEKNLGLDELGFTQKTAELLASELANIGLDPQKAAAMFVNLLKQVGSLEEALAKLFGENKKPISLCIKECRILICRAAVLVVNNALGTIKYFPALLF